MWPDQTHVHGEFSRLSDTMQRYYRLYKNLIWILKLQNYRLKNIKFYRLK